ncbi:PsbP-related protein [Atrimonas thermophila]|jgi:hypothetical protein|uniref:PsbP-related protein n=1 Tax=Atrimonas thermophila TaxID=3064161 RepID=UPI00399C61D7
MKRRVVIVGFVIFIASVSGFFVLKFLFRTTLPAPSILTTQQPWKTTFVRRGGFQVSFPADWEEIMVPPDSPDPFTAVILISPSDSPEDHFREQVGISIEYRAYSSLKSFFDTVSREVRNTPGVTLTNSGTSTIDGQPAYWLTYLWRKEDDEIEGLVYLLYGKNAFFRIICLSESKKFEEYQPLFQNIAHSLILNPQSESNNPPLSQSQ